MKAIVRAAIVLLAAFYLFLVYAVANPRVSQEYRDYYILKTTDLSIAQRQGLAPLQPGRAYGHQEAALGFDGWSAPEPSHRWSNGKRVRLIFRLDAAGAGAHALVLHVAPLGTQAITWRLNGRQLAVRELDRETELRLAFEPGLLRAGENILEIDLPGAHSPGSGDPRLLALAFKSLRIE
ncbi:hypothetical protein [Massilia sp.]|uniref:hypothetical protein n=1 Tax=Massilia sp. TaxID=1882437 RepID=UPI0028ADC490|nr:hypothetical protein [Massilia sp.]